jgi:membrane protease subunit (stomatin/prohibitin family)
MGLELQQFVVESLSLPEELQKVMDQRIGVNMAGDLGRLTQFETAEALETAAANPGGVADAGVGLGAGVAMAQAMMGGVRTGSTTTGAAVTDAATKFCSECGKSIPRAAKFCPECGKPQAGGAQ